MLGFVKDWLVRLSPKPGPDPAHDELFRKAPTPVFWLFGKTQTGKTSIIKFLTGAEEAAVGHGFRPTTKTSRRYDFPNEEAPLMTFLDTRGLGEPDYDPAEDIAQFHDSAHVVIVTVRAMDHAQETIVNALRRVRADKPDRPVLLAATCLHDAYPQQQHPTPYPFGTPREPLAVPEPLARSLAAQRETFAGLFDSSVAIDLTKAGEGFDEPEYGGEALKRELVRMLPAAYRQTLTALGGAMKELKDAKERQALPLILGYANMAAAAGAVPVPMVDLPVIAGIQSKMAQELAALYGQSLDARRFMEMAGAVGMGLAARQALLELAKLIPYMGSPAGGALAYAGTFALGKACCWYYSAVLEGHTPQVDELKRVFNEQIVRAEALWKLSRPAETGT